MTSEISHKTYGTGINQGPVMCYNNSSIEVCCPKATFHACMQIDGNRSMDAVFDNIRVAIDAVAAGKDPLEAFCQQVPEADECRVYE